MRMYDRSAAVRYSLPLLPLALFQGLQYLVYPYVYPYQVWMGVAPALLLTAWYVGFGPACLVSIVGSLSADYFFMDPRNQWALANARTIISNAIFLAVSIPTAYGLSRVRHALETAHREVKARQRIEEERKVFIAILGHDLRNPIAAVKMSAQAMMHQTRDPRVREGADRIMRVAERLTKMTNQLLDYSRIHVTGHIPIAPSEMDMRDVWEQVAQEVTVASDSNRIDVTFLGDTRGHWDRDRIEQLAQNLLVNALDYSDPQTRIKVFGYGKDGDVVIEVHNDSPAALPKEKLFEPFGSNGRRSWGSRSTGLGLYIAKQIVIAHSGEIEAESKDGEVIFTIDLPRAA